MVQENQVIWLNTEQAAKHLGCSRQFLDQDRIKKLHGIPFCKLGRHIRYNTIHLDEWLLSTRNGG